MDQARAAALSATPAAQSDQLPSEVRQREGKSTDAGDGRGPTAESTRGVSPIACVACRPLAWCSASPLSHQQSASQIALAPPQAAAAARTQRTTNNDTRMDTTTRRTKEDHHHHRQPTSGTHHQRANGLALPGHVRQSTASRRRLGLIPRPRGKAGHTRRTNRPVECMCKCLKHDGGCLFWHWT